MSSETLTGARRSSVLRGIAWMMLANCFFAAMTVSGRLASRTAHWSTVACARAGVGALVALLFAVARHRPLRTQSRGLSWARSLIGTCSMLTTFYALGSPSLAVGDATVLFSTSPILIALFSPIFLGERPGRGLWFALGLSFFGVALVAGPHFAMGGLPAWSAVTAAFCSALAMMFLRKMRSRDGDTPEAIALHFGTVGFVVFLGLNAFFFRMPARDDLLFLLLAGLTGGLAQLAMTRAYALAEAAQIGAVGYFGTVLNFGSAILFLGERPSLFQVLGALLIVTAGGSLALAAARRRTRPVAASAPSRQVVPAIERSAE